MRTILFQDMEIFTDRIKEITGKREGRKGEEKRRKEKEERKAPHEGSLRGFGDKSRQTSGGFICVRAQHIPGRTVRKCFGNDCELQD